MFIGNPNEGEFTDQRVPNEKTTFLKKDGARRFCGKGRSTALFDQDSMMTAINITSSSIKGNEANIEF